MNFKCRHCGACCEVDTDFVTLLDVSRWKREEREDILKHVRMVHDHFPTGFKEEKCPFYDKSKEKNCCLIEETKPYTCRRFPLNKKHAMSFTKDKCKGFEKK